MNYEINVTNTQGVNFLIDHNDGDKTYMIDNNHRLILNDLKNMYEYGDEYSINALESAFTEDITIDYSSLENTKRDIKKLVNWLYDYITDINELIKDGNDVEINTEIRKYINRLVYKIEYLFKG